MRIWTLRATLKHPSHIFVPSKRSIGAALLKVRARLQPQTHFWKSDALAALWRPLLAHGGRLLSGWPLGTQIACLFVVNYTFLRFARLRRANVTHFWRMHALSLQRGASDVQKVMTVVQKRNALATKPGRAAVQPAPRPPSQAPPSRAASPRMQHPCGRDGLVDATPVQGGCCGRGCVGGVREVRLYVLEGFMWWVSSGPLETVYVGGFVWASWNGLCGGFRLGLMERFMWGGFVWASWNGLCGGVRLEPWEL